MSGLNLQVSRRFCSPQHWKLLFINYLFLQYFYDIAADYTTNIWISRYLKRTLLNTIANYASVKSLMKRVNSVNTVRVRIPSGSRVLRKYLLSLYLLNYLSIIYFPIHLFVCSIFVNPLWFPLVHTLWNHYEITFCFGFPLRAIGEGVLIYLVVFLFNYPSKFAIHIVGLVGNFFTLGSTLSTPSILNVDLYLLASALSVHSLVVPINIGHHALWHVHLGLQCTVKM